jgi:hypothetical protein
MVWNRDDGKKRSHAATETGGFLSLLRDGELVD